MSNQFVSFNEEDAEALTDLALARPKYWIDNVRTVLRLGGDTSVSVSKYKEVKQRRDYLQALRISLPDRHSLQLYVSPENTLCYRAFDETTKKLLLQPLDFPGERAIDWLNAAYDNLDLLLSLMETLLEEFKVLGNDQEPHVISTALVELNPQYQNDDSREIILRPYEEHFLNMSAQAVLEVFDRKMGELKMSSEKLRSSAFILEGIRKGLNLNPRNLLKIDIILKGGKIYIWKSGANNQVGEAVIKANRDGSAASVQLDKVMNTIIFQLQEVSAATNNV